MMSDDLDMELVVALLAGIRDSPELALREVTKPIIANVLERHYGRGDWRSHISLSVAEVWDRLSFEAKLVAYVMARGMERLDDEE